MALALPKFRWLVIGAVAAGDLGRARGHEGSAPARARSTAEIGAHGAVDAEAVEACFGETRCREAGLQGGDGTTRPAEAGRRQDLLVPLRSARTALALPKAVEPPPVKPQKIVTGSIARPDKPTFMQTKAKVRLRAQARPGAAVIATLEPRTVMRELARSGEWRLVMGDGRKGWVRADYLVEATFLPRRPKLPVAEARQAKAAAQGKQQ